MDGFVHIMFFVTATYGIYLGFSIVINDYRALMVSKRARFKKR